MDTQFCFVIVSACIRKVVIVTVIVIVIVIVIVVGEGAVG